MKLLRTFLLATVALCAAFTSQAIRFSIFVDDAATIHMTANNVDVTLQNGLNTFDYSEWTNIAIEGVNPYVISKILDEAGQEWAVLSNVWEKSLYTTDDGKTFFISVRNIDETRTANFTVNVDNASKVKAVLEGSYLEIPLKNGVNHFTFDPELETSLILQSTIYEYEIFQVKVNGVVDPGFYGNYFIPLSDNCVIDITADYPDTDCEVTFEFPGGNAGFVNLFEINGAPAAFDGSPIHCKAGTKLSIYASNNYDFKYVEINGVLTDWDTGMPLVVNVKGNTNIEICALPWDVYNVYISCTNPNHIELFNGYTIELKRIEIPDTECCIQVRADNPLLTWQPASGCVIKELYIDGQKMDPTRDWWNVSEGTAIEFYTAEKDGNFDFAFWVDDRNDLRFFTFENIDRKHYDTQIKNGYNVITSYEAGNPFTLAWYGDRVTSGFVFLNEELVRPLYADTWNYELELQDEDVVKLYLTTEPEYCNVFFEYENDPQVTIIKDLVANVDKSATDMVVLAGTIFSVSSPEAIAVELNGTELTKTADGKFEFTITAVHNDVKIARTDDGAVGAINAEEADAPIFNLQGMRVNVSKDRLPAGIYISNGQKFIVK